MNKSLKEQLEETNQIAKQSQEVSAYEVANRVRDDLKTSSPLYQLSRKDRRKEKKRMQRWQDFYSKVCTAFATSIFSEGVSWESEKAAKLFDYYDNKWRTFLRYEMGKLGETNGLINTSKKRENIYNKFTEFVEKYKEDTQPKTPAKEIEVVQPQEVKADNNPTPTISIGSQEMTFEEAREYLAYKGINTKAKTKGGLEKAIAKLNNNDEEN